MPEVTLTITSPGGTRHLPLTAESLTLGRTDAADVAIADDTGLSRRHLTIRQIGKHVYAFDENSTNGTALNGAPVTPDGALLSDGDELRIGNSTLVKVQTKSETPPVALAPATTLDPTVTDAPADVATDTAAPPTDGAGANRSLFKFLVPAICLVVLILGGIGFGLYKVTSDSTSASRAEDLDAPMLTRERTTNEDAIDASGDSASEADDSLREAASPASSDVPDVVLSPPAATLADSSSSVLSADYNSIPPIEAPALTRKLYKEMSDDERREFIKRRAQHVAIMMGKRTYSFTPDALTHIKFWLDAFARRVGNNRTGLWGGDTIAILERGRTHAPTINRAFREHRVPPVVGLYIPFIETEYTNITTNNFAGAAGLFQFLGPTAEHYGVPSAERTNVEKMAPAAARYFRDNIMSFGDDSMSVALSIAGYNRAPESVKRDLRNVLASANNEDKERSFWTLIANQGKLDEYFQRENINYVPRFFAAAILGETPWAFGIEARPLSTYTQATATAPPSVPLNQNP